MIDNLNEFAKRVELARDRYIEANREWLKLPDFANTVEMSCRLREWRDLCDQLPNEGFQDLKQARIPND